MCVTWHNSTDVASSSCRATIHDSHKVFVASIQVQMQMAVAGLPCCDYIQHITVPHWMPVARAVSAKFKAFSFPVLKVIPLFRYSVLPLFRVFQYPRHYSLLLC